MELEANKSLNEEKDTPDRSPLPWDILFDQQRKQIIMLWHLCHISLVHRTQFFLLLGGDPSDQIYMEVELRRLTRLEQHLAEVGNATLLGGDEPAGSVSARYASVFDKSSFSKILIEISAWPTGFYFYNEHKIVLMFCY